MNHCASTTNHKKTPATEIKRQKEVSLGEKSVCYPILIVNTNRIQCTDLVDTGAGSSNASAALINRIGTSLVRRETKQMEMLLRNTLRKIEVRNFTISNQDGFFELNVDIHKVQKDILLSVPDPEYKTLLKSSSHHKGVFIKDNDNKVKLQLHIVLGAFDFSNIKTNMRAKIGKIGEPVTQLTKFG